MRHGGGAAGRRRASGLVFCTGLFALGALSLAGCGSPARHSTVVTRASAPVAIVALPGGRFRYAERTTGRIRDIDRRGRTDPHEVARVAVSTGGQRGLLGLAVRRGATYAAWTNRARRLVVGQVAPGPMRLIWNGPMSSDLANGGHLELAPSGQLVIGVGDLEVRSRVKDPNLPNGKVLQLDPDGPASQTPITLSSGWNNPFALAFTGKGELWVADNSPGAEPERLARGDGGRPSHATSLGRHTVPAGLATRPDGSLILCQYALGRLTRFDVKANGRPQPAGVLASDGCSGALAITSNGDVLYGTGTDIRLLHLR